MGFVCVKSMLYGTNSIFGHELQAAPFYNNNYTRHTMVGAAMINQQRKDISDVEREIQLFYVRRDSYPFGSREWLHFQGRINRRSSRLTFLRGVLEKMMEHPIPEESWEGV